MQIAAARDRFTPLSLELALRAEYLDSVVFAVSYIHPALAVSGDIVDDVELPLAGPRLSPGEQVVTVRCVLVDLRVGVTVGDVELAIAPVYGDVRRHAERLATHLGRWLMGSTECHQQLAVSGELADGAVAIVYAEDSVVRSNRDAMRIGEHALSPCINDASLGVEDYHRAGAAIEYVHLVLRVDVDRGSFFVHPTLGQSAPVGARYLVLEVAFPKHYRPLASTLVAFVSYTVLPILVVRGGHLYSPVGASALNFSPILVFQTLESVSIRLHKRQDRRRIIHEYVLDRLLAESSPPHHGDDLRQYVEVAVASVLEKPVL